MMQVTTRGARAATRGGGKSGGLVRSPCPISNALELVGDKWTLLLVRDMLRGKETYGALLDSPERIPTNILADRLRRLEDAGLVERSAYQERPARYAYRLTSKGRDLAAVLRALVGWGKRHIPGTRTIDEIAAAAPAPAAARRKAKA